MQKIEIDNIADIDLAAAEFLDKFKKQRLFAFFGEMGAGKTTFIQALCRKLDVIDVVNSPTFTIVNEYHAENSIAIYHFDFFRIKKIEEVFDFGYEDYFYSGNYCFIEWPELIVNILPDNAVLVKITIEQGGARILEIE
ncbi:MAG: tRNA (adenosine(37)-N6)-threonylcarbamoyltransferase complex ATPase subunit type 1 TsaE [Bacteroidales bacterium]|nr:tRNA (adenosine(37)-N6)-threonylcarbamoyltransferase complex ATPase subunit type 1 TsaE [Bacteroidales bacterium]